MARSTSHPDPYLADLEALQLDLVSNTPEAFLDLLRVQNCALDRLLRGLAAEESLAVGEMHAIGAN